MEKLFEISEEFCLEIVYFNMEWTVLLRNKTDLLSVQLNLIFPFSGMCLSLYKMQMQTEILIDLQITCWLFMSNFKQN